MESVNYIAHLDAWWQDPRIVTLRDNKAVIKKYGANGSLEDTIHIPTDKWPLNSHYEVFHIKNTSMVNDPQILNIFDSIPYKMGCCYTNTENMIAALTAAGYPAQSYAGWLFTGDGMYPIHHCWTVLETATGKSVLDLSDDALMLKAAFIQEDQKNPHHISKAEAVDRIAAFHREASGWPHRKRCSIVGMPSPQFFYVGCPCSPLGARAIYNFMKAKYPQHESDRDRAANGLSVTQNELLKRGLFQLPVEPI